MGHEVDKLKSQLFRLLPYRIPVRCAVQVEYDMSGLLINLSRLQHESCLLPPFDFPKRLAHFAENVQNYAKKN